MPIELEQFSKDLDNIVSDAEPSEKEFVKVFALAALGISLGMKFAEIYIFLSKEKNNERRNIGNF